MAQVKPFEYYQYEQPRGIAGMKADATNDDIFSFAAEVGMDPGKPVIRGTNPDNQIKVASAAGDAEKVIGISVHTNKEYWGVGPYYEPGYAVPVMFKGDILVEAGADVNAGEGVGLIFGDDVIFTGASDTINTSISGANTYTVATNAAASDTVVFDNVTLTGGAVSDGFVVGANAAATAANLATAFNANATVGADYILTSAGNVITVTEKNSGGGNTPGSMTFTGTVSIVGGTATTSTILSAVAESVPGAVYLDSGNEGDIVAVRITK